MFARTLALTLLALVLPVLAAAQPAAKHVVLISIDGFRPEFYRDGTWPAPVLQHHLEGGVHARAVRPVFPSVTYPDHATIVTGALPARHGIVYNSPFEPGGQTGRWYWEADSFRVPTLWDAVRAAGGTTAAVSWPVTVGADLDFNVPEVWSPDRSEDPLAPMRRHAHPAGLLETLERDVTGPLTATRITEDFLMRDEAVAAIGAYLFEQHRPTLLLVHFIGVDHYQHEEGRDGPKVRQALATADRGVGALVRAVERAGLLGETAFVVTGDHGFIETHTRLAPNRWLLEAGLVENRRDRGAWRAAFHTTGAAAFLHLRDPNDAEALAAARAAIAAQPASVQALFRVLDRADLDALGAAPGAALALAPMPGVAVTASMSAEPVGAVGGGTHGYLADFPEMQTGLVAWGVGLGADVAVPQMGLQDVAPLVAALLGLDFSAPDGLLLPGLLTR